MEGVKRAFRAFVSEQKQTQRKVAIKQVVMECGDEMQMMKHQEETMEVKRKVVKAKAV